MPKYLIVGNRRVDGAEPGQTIEVDAERGDALVRAGHLKAVVAAKKAPAPKPEPKVASAPDAETKD